MPLVWAMVASYPVTRAGAGQHPVPLARTADAKVCLECHADKAKGKVVHSAMAMGCTACHEVKTENEVTNVTLTAPSSLALCLTCHADKASVNAKGTVHAPVAKDCLTCHNPHSSANKNQLLRGASGDKSENLCLSCHDKGVNAPEKGSRHAALDAGCDTCHQTHKVGDPSKTEFAFHLQKAPPALCLDCHDIADPAVVKAHHGQPVAQADCTICHDAHQSPHSKLINVNEHPPFADGSCDSCHQSPKDGKVVLNEDGKFALCYLCHDEKQKQLEQSKTKHAAFAALEACTECHNPHASRTPKLLKSAQGQICAGCHEPSTEAVRHAPADQGQCASCHDPHGTELPKLLRAQRNDLCRACHVMGQPGVKAEGQRVLLPFGRELTAAAYYAAPKIGLDRDGERGHPLVNHPIAGKNTKLKSDPDPITCSRCHEAHASKLPKLMPKGVGDEIALCAQCHP